MDIGTTTMKMIMKVNVSKSLIIQETSPLVKNGYNLQEPHVLVRKYVSQAAFHAIGDHQYGAELSLKNKCELKTKNK